MADVIEKNAKELNKLPIPKAKSENGNAISSGKIRAALGRHIYDRYKKLIVDVNWTNWLQRSEESIRFYFNEQLSEEQKTILDERGQAIVTVNEIRPVIRHAISVLSAQNPAFDIVGITESDPKRSWVIRECVRHVLRQSVFPKEMERFTKDTVSIGRGAFLVHFDPDLDDGRGDVRISHIYYRDLIIDPDARRQDCQDARDMMIRRVLNAEDAMDMFPKYKKHIQRSIDQDLHDITDGSQLYSDRSDSTGGVSEILLGTDFNDTNEVDRVVALEYFRRIPLTVYWIVEGDTGRTLEFYTLDDAVEYRRILKDNNPEADIQLIARKTKRIEHAISINNVVVSYDILPIYEYPIIIAVDEDTYNPFPSGEIDFLKGLQEFTNKALSIVIANAQVASNNKIYMEEDALPADISQADWQNNHANPGSMNFLASGAIEKGKFKEGTAQPLNQAFMTLVQFMVGKIQSSMGMYSTAMGDPANAPETARGTLQLREWAMEKITPLLRSIDNSMTLLGRITVRYIQTYWTAEKAIRVTLDKNDPEFQQMLNNGMVRPNGVMPINGEQQSAPAQQEDKIRNEQTVRTTINDISIGRYDIEAIPRSYMPTDTMAKLNMLMDLKEKGVVDGEAVLDVLTIEDKYKIKERVSVVKQQAQQINVITEEIKKLQTTVEGMENQIRTKDREIAAMQFKIKEERRLANTYVTGAVEGARIRTARKDVEKTAKQFEELHNTTQKELIKKAEDSVKEAQDLGKERARFIHKADNSGVVQTPQKEVL